MSDNHFDLLASAYREMLAEGFHPDFDAGVEQQVRALETQGAPRPDAKVQDLRALPWSSIDNDTSRDIDQAEVAERVAGGIRLRVAIADVDSAVPLGSPMDQHAAEETTSVYTGIRTFPMLPEKLSTDLTSLNQANDRLAVVTDFVVGEDGGLTSSSIYRALVRNEAQLTYSGVERWLENGHAEAFLTQLQLQDEAAQHLLAMRHRLGALNVDRVESQPVIVDGKVQGLEVHRKTRASELIENLMIAANSVMARTLKDAGVSSIRRVVKTPERWPRIVELAARYGETLPAEPDSRALNDFLQKRKAADGVHYADLSLAVVKLMGPGEYVLSRPGEEQPGHFALAAQDYAHSTAPNRRFADTVTQRLIKSVLAGTPPPYTDEELDSIARNCTLKENAARKVERVMNKRIAAVALGKRIGETFRAVVTGAKPKGVFVRVMDPPAEGILIAGQEGVDVGDQVQVKLVGTNPEKGYIDFARVDAA